MSMAPNLARFYGDGLKWNDHCLEHYSKLFALFSECWSESVDIEPIAISLLNNFAEYELGSSFGGILPEYYGHVEHSVAFVPMFCMWCIHDTNLAMFSRMAQ